MADELPSGDPRVRLAAERTLLAWIRTGLAMMAFGFVVVRFGLFLHELAPLHPDAPPASTGLSLWIGTSLICLGVITNLVAAREHAVFLRRVERGEPEHVPRWPLGVIVSIVLAIGGVVMAIYLITLPHGT